MTKLQVNEKLVRGRLYRDAKMVTKPEMTSVIVAKGMAGMEVKRGRLYKDGKNVSKKETLDLYLQHRKFEEVKVEPAAVEITANEESLDDVLANMKVA